MSDPAPDPQPLIDALRAAFDQATRDEPQQRAFAAWMFARLDEPGERRSPVASTLPACRHLGRAIANAEAHAAVRGSTSHTRARIFTPNAAPSERTAALARALGSLASSLAWYRRIGSESHGHPFHDGHANAFIMGDDGLEARPGVAVGISLMAPHVRYPVHHHAPEELYLVLSSGHWRHGASTWFEPGIGGTVHNVPDIDHAMRSGSEPLLAIWCLLDG